MMLVFLYLLLAWGFVFGLLNAIHHIVHHEDYALSGVVASISLMLLIGIPICVIMMFS